MRTVYGRCRRNPDTWNLMRSGNLQFKTEATDSDFRYDEIGSVLKIKQIQAEKRELLESLEMYYRVFFLGEDMEDSVEHVDNEE